MNLECCKTKIVSRPGRRNGVGLLSAAMAAVVFVGCGEAKPARTPVFPIKGTITFKGQPMPGALVALHPKTPVAGTPSPRANVTKDGAFEVSTYDGGDGAPAGDYTLTVLWYKQVKNGSDIIAGPNVIPQKYAKAETSDLNISVKEGVNELPPITL